MAILVDIHKKLPGFSLDVHFEAGDETMGILGASGCGKSMTLKCIAGIETPDRGRIVLNGRTIFDAQKRIDLPPQQRKTGYLFQQYALFPHMTVAENIGVGVHLPKPEKLRLVNEKIKSFYLDGLAGHYPAQLSGGQQQRVALARIFAAEPEIIMLDEPFSALDAHLKWQVERELMKLLDGYGKTIILVSHDRDEIYRFCDKMAVLSQGGVECLSGKRDLFNKPRTLAASRLTGCKNHTAIEKMGGRTVYAVDWRIELKTATDVADTVRYIGVRAHSIERCKSGQEENRFKPRIVQIIEDTFQFMVLLQAAPEGESLVWAVDKDEWQEILKRVDELMLYIPKEKVLLLE